MIDFEDIFDKMNDIDIDPSLNLKQHKPLLEPQNQDFFKGKTFVFTGKFESFSRSELQDMVIKAGGETRSSVSARVDFLVMADNSNTTSKMYEAKRKGVSTLTETEFLTKLKNEEV